tara:strand:- start:444 stop:1064 length:621 start_codon:yes stop_codon:yes gene_type:complete
MVYFVGRDLDVIISTEEADNGLFWLSGATGPSWATDDAITKATYTLVAVPREHADAQNSGNEVKYLIGADLSVGAMDEDITYVGFRDVTKVEIKKETTLTLTRKKVDAVWDDWFNNVRFGLTGSSLIGASDNEEPTQTRGFRIWLKLKPSGSSQGDTFTLRNCCLQSHTVSTNVDGTFDETIEFMSYIDPKIGTTGSNVVTPVADL